MVSSELERYVEAHTSNENEVMAELNRQTHIRSLMPRMLSGKVQGAFLSMLSRMIRPRRILEIGTFTGYSALALAQGLREDGLLVTLEKNDEIESIAREFFAKAGMEHKIDMRIGDATEIIPEIDEEWDLVFIDADKPNYPVYFDLIVDRVRPGGWILADNVLWDGKVLDPEQHTDAYTQGIIEFNRKAQADPRVSNVLLPLRDGLMLMERL